MPGYVNYNPNPKGARVGDCTVRAISKAFGLSWESAYAALVAAGFERYDMPSSDAVWGAYLREHGFQRSIIPNDAPDGYSVADFSRDHPKGTFILAPKNHAVCLQDGCYYDTWDSGAEPVLYFWHKKED